MWWLPDIIVITTNRSPYDWYNFNARDKEREALFRRITKSFVFRNNAERVPKPVEVDINIQANFTLGPIKPIPVDLIPNSRTGVFEHEDHAYHAIDGVVFNSQGDEVIFAQEEKVQKFIDENIIF